MSSRLLIKILLLSEPMRYDEATAFTMFSSLPLRHTITQYSGSGNHPFQTLLTYIYYSLFGNKAWILRLPVFIAGILLVPTIYNLVTKYFPSGGIICATCSTICMYLAFLLALYFEVAAGGIILAVHVIHKRHIKNKNVIFLL